MVDGCPYKLTIHDTDQEPETDSDQVDVFLLTYSVTNRESFKSIAKKWKPWLDKYYPDKPIIFAANKIDERESGAITISFESGKKMAEIIKSFTYLEFSTKTQEGLRETFEKAIVAANKKKRACHSKKKNSCLIM